MKVVRGCVRSWVDDAGEDGPRRRGAGVAVRCAAVLAAAALGLTACASSGGGTVGAGASPSGATSATGTSSATTAGATPQPSDVQGPPGPTSTPAPPLPNPVKSVVKVKRSGVTGAPTVSAPAAAFSSAVVYPDGVRLRITKATKGVEQGHGPGVFAGREFVVFSLELTNGTKKAVDLNQVVVTTFYGKSRQLAPPVYTEGAGARDLTGTVAPGATTSAAYVFAVPASALGDVTMVVDFDAVHTSATYSGTVKAS